MPSALKKFRTRLGAGALVLTVAAALRAASPDSVFLEDFTSPELKAEIAGGTTSILVFSGSVEESGPGVALGKHNFRVRAYSERIARQLGHTLVAPIIPAVPTSAPLMLFPGTINVAPDVYAAYTAEIVRSMASAGFKHIFLLTDHGGSVPALKELAPKLSAELAPNGVRVDFVGDNYEKSTVEIEALAKQRGMDGSGHGGLWDTAELWAVAPHAVRPALIATLPVTPGGDAESMKQRGMNGNPTKATPELGREFGAIRVKNAVNQIQALLATESAAPAGPGKK